MIEQCCEAVDWTARNAASFGGDPDRIYLAGHSSGAHLASCVEIFSPNHFDEPRQLADPCSDLSAMLYALMKI